MRVVSLLPAATEIVAALGMTEALVGVSHDCDYPPEAAARPRVTHCEIHGRDLSGAEIDRWVRETLAATGTLYTLDEALLRRLRPDVILTQRLCDVCAVGYGTVAALAGTLPGPPRVVNLEPTSLAEILDDVRRVAEALGVPQRGEALVQSLLARVERVRARVQEAERRPRCVLLEWTEPLFCAGHWNPELVRIAGGEEQLGRAGEPSREVAWAAVREAHPEVLVVTCCGYSLERTRDEAARLRDLSGWEALPAVRNGRVYVAEGNAYFARPGPRVVDSLEILACFLQPELFPGPLPSGAALC